MTFEEINKKITAIRITSFELNYFKQEVTITAEPEYGFADEFRDKKIQFIFRECILFASTNLSTKTLSPSLEIVSWGKTKDYSILNNLISSSISKNFNTFGLADIDYKNIPDDYSLYFFENTFGGLIKIIAKSVDLEIQ